MERYLLQTDGGVLIQKTEVNTKQAVKTKRYKVAYLNYGFTSVSVAGQVRPQCVMCAKILSNNSMGATKLKHHLKTRHPSLVGKKGAFFAHKLQQINKQRITLRNAVSAPGGLLANAVEALYRVALLIAQTKQPYEIGEKLILPAATEICRIMHGESAAEKMKSIEMSPRAVICRISDLAENLSDQLLSRLKCSNFTLLLDQVYDLDEGFYLVAYVRYCHETAFLEDVFFCQSFKDSVTADELFQYIENTLCHFELKWKSCTGISTDAGRLLGRCWEGFRAKVLDAAPHISWTYCMIHRETLVNSTLDEELQDVLNSAILEVSVAKTDSRMENMLSGFTEGMCQEDLDLLLKTDFNWLSRRSVLQSLFERKLKYRQYVLEKNIPHCQTQIDPHLLVLLAYLVDIFDKLNSLNLSLQGREGTTVHLHQKVFEFKQKIDLWKASLEAGAIVSFPLLTKAVAETQYALWRVEVPIINHLTSLKASLDKYFPKEHVRLNEWVQNPFTPEGPSTVHLPRVLREQVNKLRSDLLFEMCFENQSLEEFWFKVAPEYPVLSKCAIAVLLPFGSTSLSEIGFSALVGLRTMYNSSSEIEDHLRLCVSTIQPQIDQLVSKELNYVSD